MVSAFGKASITFYALLIWQHLKEIMIDLAAIGLTLPMISQEGLEQSNSVFKNTIEDSTSPAAEFYGKTQLIQYLQSIYRPKFMEWMRIVDAYRIQNRVFKEGTHKPYKRLKIANGKTVDVVQQDEVVEK